MTAAAHPATPGLRGPGPILRVIAVLVLVDVVAQYVGAIQPMDIVSPGWRLTAAQLATTQLLPIGMALFLWAVGRSSSGRSLRPVQLSAVGLAILCLAALGYLASDGLQFVRGAQPEFYARVRVGLAQALIRSATGLVGFGVTALLLWRRVPDAPPKPAHSGLA